MAYTAPTKGELRALNHDEFRVLLATVERLDPPERDQELDRLRDLLRELIAEDNGRVQHFERKGYSLDRQIVAARMALGRRHGG